MTLYVVIVRLSFFDVLTPVELDREPRRVAVEVQDEATVWVLSTEFEAIETFCTEEVPGSRFGVRLLCPQLARVA